MSAEEIEIVLAAAGELYHRDPEIAYLANRSADLVLSIIEGDVDEELDDFARDVAIRAACVALVLDAMRSRERSSVRGVLSERRQEI